MTNYLQRICQFQTSTYVQQELKSKTKNSNQKSKPKQKRTDIDASWTEYADIDRIECKRRRACRCRTWLNLLASLSSLSLSQKYSNWWVRKDNEWKKDREINTVVPLSDDDRSISVSRYCNISPSTFVNCGRPMFDFRDWTINYRFATFDFQRFQRSIDHLSFKETITIKETKKNY